MRNAALCSAWVNIDADRMLSAGLIDQFNTREWEITDPPWESKPLPAVALALFRDADDY